MTYVEIQKFVCDGCHQEHVKGDMPKEWITLKEYRPPRPVDEFTMLGGGHYTMHFCSWPCLRFYAEAKENGQESDGARVTTAVNIAADAISIGTQ